VSSSHLDTQVSGHHRDHQIYRGQTDSQDANLLISCDTTVDVGPTEGTIGPLGAPLFSVSPDTTQTKTDDCVAAATSIPLVNTTTGMGMTAAIAECE